ncbi:MAG TPA: STAS domain-containing protein [Gemmataceae bacterium]|jgi:anti-anti-sigma factor
MNSTTLPTIKEWNLELSLQADEQDLLQIQCAGDVVLPDFQPENDPLVKFLGPQVYSRKLLLNMERTNFLDTSGIGWLISCHEHCQRAGGILVLHSIPTRVRYILQLLQMEHLLHLAIDLAAARAIAFKGG